MNNKKRVLKLINDCIEIINNMDGLSKNEVEFIKKYLDNLKMIKKNISTNKIDLEKRHPMTGGEKEKTRGCTPSRLEKCYL